MGTKIFGIWNVLYLFSHLNLVVNERKYVYNQDNDLCIPVFFDYGHTNIVEMTWRDTTSAYIGLIAPIFSKALYWRVPFFLFRTNYYAEKCIWTIIQWFPASRNEFLQKE